jgi:hypothetical protein
MAEVINVGAANSGAATLLRPHASVGADHLVVAYISACSFPLTGGGMGKTLLGLIGIVGVARTVLVGGLGARLAAFV